MSFNTLSINGTPLADIYVDASLAFNKPAKDVETFSIPGRSGDLVIDSGTFQNVLIVFPCFMFNGFPSKFETLVNYLGSLSGYQRIECNNDSTHFRLGVPVIPETPTVRRINQDGYFNLAFNCKPQRFLISGETVVTKNASGTISNPTAFASQPLLRIYGTGKFTINGVQITVGSHGQSYVDVDCEMMDCYNGATSLNSYISFSGNDFPVLSPGSNSFTFGTGITQVRITPRWWEL